MSEKGFNGRFKSYQRAQQAAERILWTADMWTANGPLPSCTKEDFSDLLDAVGRAILNPGMGNLFYYLACAASGTERQQMLANLLQSRVRHEQLSEQDLLPYHEREAAVPPGTRKQAALDELRRLCPDTIEDEEPSEFETLQLGNVPTAEVDWLIPGLIARGEMALIGADGGTGKGIYYSQLIAAVTTGKGNDFFPEAPKEPGSVLILSGEDDPSKVLRPRLLAAGADLSKVNVITADSYFRQRGTLLTIDSQALQAKISQLKPDLVINDPIQAFLPAGLQMNNRSEMRGVVTPFKSFCAAVNAAGATVCHTNKKSNVAGRQRLSDSSDLWDLSRCVIMLGYSKTDEAVYASVEKDSYARKPMTTLFTIEGTTVEGVRTAVAVYKGRTDRNDADFVFQRTAKPATTRDSAKDAILSVLEDSKLGSLPSTQLQTAVLNETGCSVATYQKAYKELVNSKQIVKKPIHKSKAPGAAQWFTFLADCYVDPIREGDTKIIS